MQLWRWYLCNLQQIKLVVIFNWSLLLPLLWAPASYINFYVRVVTSLSYVGMSSQHLGTGIRKHLNLADINTNSAITDHLYDCDKCSFMRHAGESLKGLKKCATEYDTKIQKAIIKKLNPKLNKQLYAKGVSFLLSILRYILVCIILQF